MSLSLFDLSGRRALITGSSKGIGFAYATGMAEAGCEIVLNGRNEEVLEHARSRLSEDGHSASAYSFDVTDHAASAAAVDRIENEIGPIDILVNNAGMTIRHSLEDYPLEDWRTVLSTNLDSVYNVSQATARHMLKRGKGKIVNTCSVLSEITRPGAAAYSTSKGAVKMLTKTMAVDWATRGITVNGIGPGFFVTDLNRDHAANPEFRSSIEARTPMKRWGELDELVGAAIFLASDASSFVTGHIIYVDGGVTAAI
ncbi:MAG: SDR family oxidoreductase [Pseudomonadota bacterium]